MTDLYAIRAEHEAGLFARLLATEEGRYFVHWLMDVAGVHAASFADTEAVTAYREGRRSIGLIVRELVQQVDPQYLWRMDQEALNREAYYVARAGQDND